MDTFRTTHRRDFGWPWPYPVLLTAWRPPPLTVPRDRWGPGDATPDCPCPEHSWQPGSDLYGCLAHKEGRLHQRAQAVRHEIRRCLNRKQQNDMNMRRKYPPVPGVPAEEEWKSTYIGDYTKKDTVPLDFVGLLTELVSTGVPPAPLGKSLYGMHHDPTRFRSGAYNAPLYEKNASVAERELPDIWEQWYDDFPTPSEYMVRFSQAGENLVRRCQPFKHPLPKLTD